MRFLDPASPSGGLPAAPRPWRGFTVERRLFTVGRPVRGAEPWRGFTVGRRGLAGLHP